MTDAEISIADAPAVLQVLPRLVTGGVERGTVEVAAALVAQGWRAVVASAGGPMAREVERAGGIHVELPLASKNPLVMRRNVDRLAQMIADHRVAIVHARSRAPAWSALYAARRGHAHFVTTFHNAYGAESWLKRRYNAVMAEGERVIAISDFVASHAMATYDVAPERLRVIPRGVDFFRFDPERTSADRMIRLSREWGLPDGVPVVMLPGRLTRWKGHTVLIEALRRLGRGGLHCVIVGSGARRYRRELEAAIGRHPLPCTIGILDECRDMPAAYMLADVVVSASTEPEGFGRVIVEAQAMGRPVVATAHGGAVETVVPGETGWLVPPNDADALAAGIAAALDLPPEARLALAERAITHVRTNFTVELMTARTLAVYEEVLGAAGAKAQAQDTVAA